MSATYTIKATGENIKKLKELELITEKEYNEMKELHKKAVVKYMTKELGM